MSTGTRGGHKALVAARWRIPRPPGTPDVNVSWRLLQRRPGPRPPPPAAAHHQAPPPLASARARGLLGGVVRSPAEAGASCLAGTTTPRKHRDQASLLAPPGPSTLGLSPAATSECGLRAGVLGIRALGCSLLRCPGAPEGFQALLHAPSRLFSICRARKG